MANTAFPKGAEKILSGAINLVGNTIKVALLPSTYVYSAGHEFVSQLGTRIGTDQTLTGKTIVGGVFDADNPDYGIMLPGSAIRAVAIYKDTGNPSTSPLLLFYDSMSGLPLDTNGGGVTIPWADDAKKIARLGLPFYPKGGQAVFSGGINFMTADLKVALVPASYVYDESHEFLSSVGTLIGAPKALAGRSVTGGVLDATDIDFGSLPAGPAAGSAVIYKDTGSAATSQLLLRITDIAGLPLTPNGSGVSVQWSNGTAKIISLVPA